MEKTIIEINGVKLEVDLRTAKKIDQFKVGDSVKVLYKYYSDWKTCPGVIIGFSEFQSTPSIEVLFLYDSDVKFKSFNSNSKDIEIAPYNGWELKFEKEDVLYKLERQVERHEVELQTAKHKAAAFKEFFGVLFNNEN